MFPLASLPSLLAVLVLCRSPLAIASISEPILSGTACGGDQVAVFDASDGVLNLSINGVLTQDRVLGCEKLLSYFGSGCLRCNQLPDVWRGAVKQYCSEGSAAIHVVAASAQNVPRKFLKPQVAHSNKIDYGPCGKISLHGNDQETNDSSGNGDHHLAVPGVILLCCGLMFPCFHAGKKEASRYKTATIQRNTGEGGFGMVYRAVLPDGQVVAVKRAKKDQFAGPRDEFSNEVELLAKIDHRNLVRLLGFTDKGNERIIITEYVPNGTLREHLDGQHGRVLDFNQRLEIAIDVAHALTYLHLYAGREILDPLLEDPVDDEVLEKLLSLAFQCAAPTREDRPTMKEVGEQLWEIRKEYGKSVRKV
ncbi:hypothetical protein PR202_gb29861 [Eleusine coracana subsp. coracana]|uniref:Protein kinase domain-containing protein n=1 Tax=Eleusine coracana subsp. coracana TaxID=191504 RepID=A0AAV5G186_ELECO|nr:hypothetical protein PR202_gb29861 [Eleusine coracana subsp. coracana]